MREGVATLSCVKIRLSALDKKYTIITFTDDSSGWCEVKFFNYVCGTLFIDLDLTNIVFFIREYCVSFYALLL